VYLFGSKAAIVYQSDPRSSFVSAADDDAQSIQTLDFGYSEEVSYEFSSRHVISRDRALSMLASYLTIGEPNGLIPFLPQGLS
jgi:hypothetical protein